MKKTFIVIAAYNVESSIKKVVESLHKHNYNNIVVVDDGSKDNTYDIISKLDVTALKHIINRGQGAALKTGIDYALNNGADIIVTFDADGQHDPSEVHFLVESVAKGDVDAALGSRFLKQETTEKVPKTRRLFLKWGAFIIRTMYGIKLTDSHNGFRAFSSNAARKIKITCDRMEHASEILEEIARKKIKYKEVPVTITYSEYSLKHGQSTFNAFRIFFKMIMKKLTR